MRAFREMALRVYNRQRTIQRTILAMDDDNVRHVTAVILASMTLAEGIKYAKKNAIKAHVWTIAGPKRYYAWSADRLLKANAVYAALLAWWVISKLRRRPHALSWLRERGATYNLLR